MPTQLNQHHFHLSENCFLISVTPEYVEVNDCSWIRNGNSRKIGLFPLILGD